MINYNNWSKNKYNKETLVFLLYNFSSNIPHFQNWSITPLNWGVLFLRNHYIISYLKAIVKYSLSIQRFFTLRLNIIFIKTFLRASCFLLLLEACSIFYAIIKYLDYKINNKLTSLIEC